MQESQPNTNIIDPSLTPVARKNPIGIKIVGFSDHRMWYSQYRIGDILPWVRTETDCYISREPGGYTNIIKLSDGELVYSD